MLSRHSDARRAPTLTPKYCLNDGNVILLADLKLLCLRVFSNIFTFQKRHCQHVVSGYRLCLHPHGRFGVEQRKGFGKTPSRNCWCHQTQVEVWPDWCRPQQVCHLYSFFHVYMWHYHCIGPFRAEEFEFHCTMFPWDINLRTAVTLKPHDKFFCHMLQTSCF